MDRISFIAILSLLLSSPVVGSDESDWLLVANQGIERGDPRTIERALDLCEQTQYLSVSRSLASAFAPRLHPIICSELERQFLAFYAASIYLDRAQEHPSDTEDLRVAANRLYTISYRHPFLASRLIVAKARAIDGGHGYDISPSPPIPLNTKWHFWYGAGLITDDYTEPYQRLLRSRSPSILAAFCIVGFVIPCAFTLRGPESVEIHALARFPISLIVTDEGGHQLDLPELRRLAAEWREEKE